MSWARSYRLALRLLPAGLRRKHGPAMEALFARELGQARELGWSHGAVAGVAGVWDVVRRGAYERLRPAVDAVAGRGGREAGREWDIDLLRPAGAGAHRGGPYMRGPLMPQPTTRQLLRRHAASFAIAFVALTASMLALFATQRVPALAARGAPAGAILEALLLAVPFTAALTLPMAVLVAVLHEFTRLGANGTLTAARHERGGIRRLVVPVLAAATGVAALTLVVTAEIVPDANARLATVLWGSTAAPSDRTMTIGELRQAARSVRPDAEPVALARAAAYEVELQKKLALPAACVVLALVGMAVALRIPRGGWGLVIVASCATFGAYYVLLVMGEDLADRLVVSPVVGMWGANAILLAAALTTVWWHRAPRARAGGGAVVIGG